jgi:transmembrane sensor
MFLSIKEGKSFMSKEQFELAKLVSQYLQGALNADEEANLLMRAEKDEQLRQLLEQYAKTPILAEDLAVIENIDKEAGWDLVLQKYKQPNAKRKQPNWFRWKWLSIAAVFLLLCGITWWRMPNEPKSGIIIDHQYGYRNDVLPGGNKAILTLSSGKKIVLDGDSLEFKDGKTILTDKAIDDGGARKFVNVLNQISVPRGGNYHVKLPDGSNVWLNAASILEFPAQFTKEERSVKLLAGEAYFEIAEMPNNPFTVYTDNLHVEALGTAFNINIYTKGQVKTILTEGKVKVSNQKDQKIISPGYSVLSTLGSLSVQKADIEEALSWKDGYFYFDGKNLHQILEEVARWYNVRVNYNGEISKERYRGGIKRTVTLANVCQMLSDLSGHRFTIEEKNLTVI